jgi:hypothetical protein
MDNDFLNIAGGYAELIKVGVDFGVQYLTAQSENKKNLELVKRIGELNAEQGERLKKLLSQSITENAKTQVILEFLNDAKIKELQAETKKKRILPLIGLGFGVLLLGIIFYKLNKQNG